MPVVVLVVGLATGDAGVTKSLEEASRKLEEESGEEMINCCCGRDDDVDDGDDDNNHDPMLFPPLVVGAMFHAVLTVVGCFGVIAAITTSCVGVGGTSMEKAVT